MCVHAQSCLTFCDPMNCSLPVSSIHGIFQARILESIQNDFLKSIFTVLLFFLQNFESNLCYDFVFMNIYPWHISGYFFASTYMVFPVVMYECDSWTIKKVECRRIDASELWCCRRLFRESLGLQGDQTSQSERKPTPTIHRTVAETSILWPPDGTQQLT